MAAVGSAGGPADTQPHIPQGVGGIRMVRFRRSCGASVRALFVAAGASAVGQLATSLSTGRQPFVFRRPPSLRQNVKGGQHESNRLRWNGIAKAYIYYVQISSLLLSSL